MGIYDREYYRDEDRGVRWQFGSPAKSATIQLMAAIVIAYIACVLAGQQLTNFLSLQAASIYKPWMWWQVVSYGFVHNPNAAWHVAANLMGLWFFGAEIESVYGRKSYLRLYFAAVVLGALVWLARLCLLGSTDPDFLARFSLLGASGGVTAVVILFCLKFPTRIIYLMFVLPAPAWVLGVLIILGDLMIGGGAGGQGIAFDVHLTGALLAFVFFRFGDRLGWSKSPRIASKRSGWSNMFGWLKPKPKLKIHKPSAEGDAEVDPEMDYDELDRRGDEVLDKWHRDGEESLSPEEKKILKAYSRRMKQKHR